MVPCVSCWTSRFSCQKAPLVWFLFPQLLTALTLQQHVGDVGLPLAPSGQSCRHVSAPGIAPLHGCPLDVTRWQAMLNGWLRVWLHHA
mmetsp:Transcript_193/g.91  ORF Transcript_193/g.91 Transcript_193/m.91 type:complete len:88 (-) Transcript_193:54-317(-)